METPRDARTGASAAARVVPLRLPRAAQTVAAIDLGSNSFHMIVARILNGQLHVLDRLQEMVRLAAGLDERGRLDKASQRRALECLERFGQRVRGLPAKNLRVVGTNTLRRARNASKFLAAAERSLGHPIEVISGQEEARLIYLGVAHNLPNDANRRLVLDIGGGSTELIVGERFEPVATESLHMGCVSMSLAHFPRGAITPRGWKRAHTAALLELQPVESSLRALGWRSVFGASGTVRAIGAAVRAIGSGDAGITLSALYELRDRVLASGHVRRLRLAGVSIERAPVLPGGLAILVAAFEALGIERLHVADGALREGLLHDLLGRLGSRDVRARTTQALCARYHVDTAQSERVERTVRTLLGQLQEEEGLNEEEVHLLCWAARLHEIGLAIAHTKYHRHGAYLIEHSDLPGFSFQEQRLLAALVRGHRRRFPRPLFEEMPRAQARGARRACLLLRLAVLLNRARTDVELPRLRLEMEKKTLRIRFPRAWLARHPLTRADLAVEARYLRAAGMRLEFE